MQVLEIGISSHGSGAVEMPKFVEPLSEARSEKNVYGALADLSQKVYQFRFYSQCYFPMQQSDLNVTHKVEYQKVDYGAQYFA